MTTVIWLIPAGENAADDFWKDKIKSKTKIKKKLKKVVDKHKRLWYDIKVAAEQADNTENLDNWRLNSM